MFKKLLLLFKRRERPHTTYKDEISKAIIQSNFLGITKIWDIELLKNIPFNPDTYQQLVALIKTSSIDQIKMMPAGETIFEDLTVVKFKAKNGNYIAAICDSFEIFNGFIVIDIFPLKG